MDDENAKGRDPVGDTEGGPSGRQSDRDGSFAPAVRSRAAPTADDAFRRGPWSRSSLATFVCREAATIET